MGHPWQQRRGPEARRAASRRAPAPAIVYSAHARRGACPPAPPRPGGSCSAQVARVGTRRLCAFPRSRALRSLYKPPRGGRTAFRAQRSALTHALTHTMSTMSYDSAYPLADDGPQPVSRTYQYRKVMKPMLERKRRARINRCLDELKELMVSALQSEGENVAKLEKADILELTVRHLHKLRRQRRLSLNPTVDADRFRAGFTHAANEVSRCLASIPGVDVRLGTQLMTHLGHRLNDIQRAAGGSDTPPASPPSPALSTASSSSGYVTPSPPASPVPVHTAVPLDCTTSSFPKPSAVWRPW